MDFNTFDLELGINVNIIRYLNNQPVRLVAKSLSKNIPFFYVEFLLVEENGEMVTPDTMTSQELERLDLTDNGLPEQVKSAEIELAKYQ